MTSSFPSSGVRSSSGLAFYDWETLELVRRIEIQPRSVFWNESGELVAITTDDGYFVLSFDQSAVTNATEEETNEDGVESAFDVSRMILLVYFVALMVRGLLSYKCLGLH